MTAAVPPLLLTLLLGGLPTLPDPLTGASSAPRIELQDTGTGVEWRWSAPPATSPTALADWHLAFERELRPVMSAWKRMLRRLQGDLPARFEPQCKGLVASLDGLDHPAILPAPDRLIDFYLRRLFLHLRAAANACTRQELWNVVYRLDEARTNLGEVRWLLQQKGLR